MRGTIFNILCVERISQERNRKGSKTLSEENFPFSITFLPLFSTSRCASLVGAGFLILWTWLSFTPASDSAYFGPWRFLYPLRWRTASASAMRCCSLARENWLSIPDRTSHLAAALVPWIVPRIRLKSVVQFYFTRAIFDYIKDKPYHPKPPLAQWIFHSGKDPCSRYPK